MNAVAVSTVYATPWPPEGAVRFRARAFAGDVADLDLDWETMPSPALVTEVLSRCLCGRDGGESAPETIWRWSVAERLQGLLAVARATDGAHVAALAQCSNRACGQRIELELGLAGFAGERASDVECDSPDGHRVRCRLPTGADLTAWLRESDGDERWMARRLVVAIDDTPPAQDWELPVSWLAPIAEALQSADPLTALSLDVTCPFCARELAVEVDLEALLLDALARRQRAVLEEVHRLASVYHWNETEIVAMPAWRRRRYLARIEAEFA